MTRRTIGGNARNGVNLSQAFSQVATAWGYFLPHFALNASSSVRAAFSSAAWYIGFNAAATALRSP